MSYSMTAPRQMLPVGRGRGSATQTITKSGDLVPKASQNSFSNVASSGAEERSSNASSTPNKAQAAPPRDRWAEKFGNLQAGQVQVGLRGNAVAAGRNAKFDIDGDTRAVADVVKNTFETKEDLQLKVTGGAVGVELGEDDPSEGNKINAGRDFDFQTKVRTTTTATAVISDPAAETLIVQSTEQTTVEETSAKIVEIPDVPEKTDELKKSEGTPSANNGNQDGQQKAADPSGDGSSTKPSPAPSTTVGSQAEQSGKPWWKKMFRR